MAKPKRKKIDVKNVLGEAVVYVSEELSNKEIKVIVEKYRNDTCRPFMPLGENCSYLFSYTTFSMIEIDNSVSSVLGLKRQEIINTSFDSIFSTIIAPEHSTTATRFSKLVFESLEKYSEKDAVVNFEFDIYKSNSNRRRILNQYKVLVKTKKGTPLLLQGNFMDITDLHPSGPPVLQILIDNKVVISEKGTREEMLAGLELDISIKELEILALKGHGLQAKEIAKKTGLTTMSVYSILRDLKRKTGMEPIPLIELLKDKGLLH